MSPLLRRLARTVLPVALFAIAAPALASTAATPLPVDRGSAYGAYLAGQQAMRDLSTADAARFFSEAVGNWSDPTVATNAFLAYLGNGQMDKAVDAANHILALDPKNSLAKLAIATQELRDRRYKAVEQDLDGVSTSDFAGITAAILRAWALVGDGREAEAFVALDKVGKQGLEDFLAFHRALMADVSGDQASALTLAAKAYQANQQQARVVEAYARMLGNAGRFDDGLAVIKKFDDNGLGDPIVDQVQRALEAHQRPGLFAANPQAGAAEMYHGIAVALARDGSDSLVIAMLQLGLSLDPHNDVLALLAGQLLDDNDQHDAADRFYSGIAADSPMHVTAAVRLAQNEQAKGDRPGAIKQLEDIVASNPTDLDALTVLGEMLRVDKQYDASAKAYSQAIDIDAGAKPADWVLYYERGIAYERGGEWDKAQPDFLKALQLNPDQPAVLNYLGYTWVDKGQNLDQALEMIQKAVKATPNDGFIVDSLGWAFYKLGRFSDAVQTLEQAVQLKPNDPQINDHLGDAYWKDGRQLEAHFQWNVASSLDTDGSLKAELAKKQANGLDGATAAVSTP